MAHTPRSKFKVVRISRAHPRLIISIVLGIAAYVLLTTMAGQQFATTTRLVIAWDIGVAFYLVWLAVMMVRSKQTDIAQHADAQDEGEFGMLVLTVIAAMASLAAIFLEL